MEENTSHEGVRMQLGNRVTVEERRTETDGTEDSSKWRRAQLMEEHGCKKMHHISQALTLILLPIPPM